MVTISNSHSPVAARSNTPVSEVFCLSCDTLPTTLGNGSEAFEIDTGTKYYLDATDGDPKWYDTSGNARTVTALTSPTVAKEAQTTKLFDVAVSKMQQNDIPLAIALLPAQLSGFPKTTLLQAFGEKETSSASNSQALTARRHL